MFDEEICFYIEYKMLLDSLAELNKIQLFIQSRRILGNRLFTEHEKIDWVVAAEHLRDLSKQWPEELFYQRVHQEEEEKQLFRELLDRSDDSDLGIAFTMAVRSLLMFSEQDEINHYFNILINRINKLPE